MKLPKARNILLTALVVVLFTAVGLLIAQDQETLRVRTPIGAADARFPEYLARLLGAPLTTGDSYVVYTNGTEAYPAMLAAIESAQHRVSFETYIYSSGETAERFTAAFEAAARRGVNVRLVLDSIGASDADAEHLERLEKAGCEVVWFNQVASPSVEELNYRTHRKSLVVDGAVAFVGGIGVADHWAKDTEVGPMWRDTQIALRGPAAVYVEASFNENWIESGREVAPDLLRHDDDPAAHARSIVVWASAEGGANAMKLLYLLAIGSARQSLDIASPYLILDESTDWSLMEARTRGVRIRILVEGDITDAKPVKFASRASYERLLAAGIEVHEYLPAMMHTKTMTIDGVLSVFGSANLDNRSLELNDELNIAVFDPGLAARLRQDFEQDLTKAPTLDLDEWRSRPLHIRGRDQFWSLFGEVF